MDGDAYGLPGVQALDTPYGLPAPATIAPRPRSAALPAAPLPLSPLYRPMGALPQMAGRVGPLLSTIGRVSRGLGNVLPFPANAVAKGAGAVADTGAKIISKGVNPDSLTDWIRRTESSGNYQALNRERPGNTASGAYQYTDATWNGYGGYKKAMFAPKEVQDRRFREDIQKRLATYGGDPFKAIAAHYLPAYANNPAAWNQHIRVGKVTVSPVAAYVRKVVKGTPLEADFDEYLKSHQG